MGARVIRPKPEDLLSRLAAVLDETVAPHITHGPARRQLKAATAALRRLAYGLPRQPAVIAEDTADLEKTLREACTLLGEMAAIPDAKLDADARNLVLQHAVVDMQMRLPGMQENLRTMVAEILDGYYRRAVERDLTLNSPGHLAGGDKNDG
jgi:hypothetical protein